MQGGLSPAHWLSGSVTLWGVGDRLLTEDKYSLGKILPAVPLGLSFQVGQGDILLFSLLSIYLTVQMALMTTHFPDEFGAMPKRLALLVSWLRGLHQSTGISLLAPWARPWVSGVGFVTHDSHLPGWGQGCPLVGQV